MAEDFKVHSYCKESVLWQIFHTLTPNVTTIIAPYRVRVTEMVIEVTFGETVEYTPHFLTFVMFHS